jgi:hypothetical protein
MKPRENHYYHLYQITQSKEGCLMNYGFEGKVALVTGASGGIGRAIALAFAASGAVGWVMGGSVSRSAGMVGGRRQRIQSAVGDGISLRTLLR